MSLVSRETFVQEPPTVDITVVTTPTVVIASIDLLKHDKKCFTVRNTGATAFNTGIVQASPDGVNWETINNTTLNTLAGGAMASVQVFNDSRRFWRMTASVAAGSTTAKGWVHCGDV